MHAALSLARGRNRRRAAFEARFFLRNHRVGAGRDFRPGHNPRALIFFDFARERAAGERFADDGERGFFVRAQIGEAASEAVHRRIVVPRDIERGGHIARQNPPERFAQGDFFLSVDGIDARQNLGARLVDAEPAVLRGGCHRDERRFCAAAIAPGRIRLCARRAKSRHRARLGRFFRAAICARFRR